MSRRAWIWILSLAATVAVGAWILAVAIDEPLRRQLEQRMNAQLEGYEVTVGRLDVHPLRFALDLEDLVIRQEAHPEPPVAWIERLGASIEWRALLRARLVGDVVFDRPVIYLDLTRARAEANDPVPVTDRGWQDAVEAIYPLEINALWVRNGSFTYVEPGAAEPVRLTSLDVLAENIRNVRSEAGVYPSDLHVEGLLHEDARLTVDGRADFLAEPYAAVRATVGLQGLRLHHLAPMVRHADVALHGGVLSLDGRFEYAPRKRLVELQDLTLRDLNADYVYRDEPVGAKKEEPAAAEPPPEVRVDQLRIERGEVGLVNETVEPPYRLFLDRVEATVRNVRVPAAEETGNIVVRGRLMGSGESLLRATFRRGKEPDVGVNLRVVDVRLPELNGVLRAHGGFDVAAGEFSVFSELRMRGKAVEGYVKPLLRDMDVYEPAQDADKSVFRKIYEVLVGVGATVFRNQPREQVATRIPISGRLDDPKLGTLQAIIGIVRNAFLQAVRPGLEERRAAAPQ